MKSLNTASRKMFDDIFQLINQISEKSEVNILWYYKTDDDDIEEIGHDFEEYTKASFELIAID